MLNGARPHSELVARRAPRSVRGGYHSAWSPRVNASLACCTTIRAPVEPALEIASGDTGTRCTRSDHTTCPVYSRDSRLSSYPRTRGPGKAPLRSARHDALRWSVALLGGSEALDRAAAQVAVP
jgi:hypothetical protein